MLNSHFYVTLNLNQIVISCLKISFPKLRFSLVSHESIMLESKIAQSLEIKLITSSKTLVILLYLCDCLSPREPIHALNKQVG